MTRAAVLLLAFAFSACAPSEPEASHEPVYAPDPDEQAIHDWLTVWSRAQAAEVRRVCREEPGCDPAEYEDERRPETTFGWSGATSIRQIQDWARGPRFEVEANGREVLIYLENHRVVGAYSDPPNTPRRAICRDTDCYPNTAE